MGEFAARTLVYHLKDISNLQQINTIIVSADFISRKSSLKIRLSKKN
jgi:LacI family transcriptional regulator